MYYVYILRCEGDALYTGITTDPERRIKEHFSGVGKCAKYTRSHPPKRVETVIETDTKGHASSLEYRIKQLPKGKKEKLISERTFEGLFGDKIVLSDYGFCDGEFTDYLNSLLNGETVQ